MSHAGIDRYMNKDAPDQLLASMCTSSDKIADVYLPAKVEAIKNLTKKITDENDPKIMMDLCAVLWRELNESFENKHGLSHDSHGNSHP